MIRTATLALVAAFAASGCYDHAVGPPSADAIATQAGGASAGPLVDAIVYRDLLSQHPGCSAAGLDYAPASIPGYKCAAKEYPFPAGVGEDESKPIVLLVHGNSDFPDSWERFPADTGEPMLAEQLSALGFRTIAVDLRIDLVDDPQGNNDTENAARNVNHGWSVPVVQHLVESVLQAWPERRISMVGFSLGATVIRDALRRLHGASRVSPFEHIEDLVYLAGAHHGVSTYARLCGRNPTMRGEVACEMGSRDSFAPTDFLVGLNGPRGAWETPCSDGSSAYGAEEACGGNTVTYTTVVMRDIADGSYQDEFVSEASAALDGAQNELIELEDVDETGYFFNGLLRNHYGSARSAAALSIAVAALSDEGATP